MNRKLRRAFKSISRKASKIGKYVLSIGMNLASKRLMNFILAGVVAIAMSFSPTLAASVQTANAVSHMSEAYEFVKTVRDGADFARGTHALGSLTKCSRYA